MEALSLGKNDPCPCNSGKKFRQCCWLKRFEWAKKPPPVPDAPCVAKTTVNILPSDGPTYWKHPPGQPGAVTPPEGTEWVEWVFVKDKGWTHESDLKPGDQIKQRGGGWATVPEPQTIETTQEHPFYVKGKGWTPLSQIKPGDEIRGEDGWVTVTEVTPTNRWEKVYNFRVAEHHTYFVGAPEWGFSVWAHNADCAIVEVGGRFELVELATRDVSKALHTATTLTDTVRFAQRNGHAIRNMTVEEQLLHLGNYTPHPRLEGAPTLNHLFPELQTPLPVYRIGETEAVFVYRGQHGRVEVPLVSAEVGPGQVFAQTGMRLDYPMSRAVAHVEGHSAGLMHSFSIREASVYVNYFDARLARLELAGPCSFCRPSISRLIPEKSILNVFYVEEGGGRAAGIFVGGERGFHQLSPPLSRVEAFPPRHLRFPPPGS